MWRVPGEIVFNKAPDGTGILATAVKANGTAFEYGVPQQLPFPPNAGHGSTLSDRDGQRFLVELGPPTAGESISVVLNWPALVTP